MPRRSTRRYLRARNRQSPLPVSSRKPPLLSLSVPIVPFAHENAQLQIPTVNRRFSRVLSLSLLFPSFTFSSPSDPCNLLFPLSPLSGLSRRKLSLFLLLFLCLFLSFSRVPDSHILDRGSSSLSLLSLSALTPLSLNASGLSRYTRVLNPS